MPPEHVQSEAKDKGESKRPRVEDVSREGGAAAFAGVGDVLGILRLQRTIGNHAVQRMLAKLGSAAGPPEPMDDRKAGPLPRQAIMQATPRADGLDRPAPARHNPRLAAQAATEEGIVDRLPDVYGADGVVVRRKETDSSPSPSPGIEREAAPAEHGIERIKKINNNWWVGKLDQYELEAEWTKLGPKGAVDYPDDFMRSIKFGMEPDNLQGANGVGFVMEKFQQAVEGLTAEYLEGNLKDIAKEEKSLGVDEKAPSAEQDANLTELVALAERAKSLDELAKKYGVIQVGYNNELVRDKTDPEGHGRELAPVAAHFSPGHPPETPLKGNEAVGARPYDEVQANYALTMGGLMAIANQHPSIYLALKSGQLDAITGKGEKACEDPLAAIKTVLGSTKKAIEETKAKKIGWKELQPIHQQLLRGEKSTGGINFSELWNREIVKDVLDFHETKKTLVDLGIGLAAACAFIFSEIATGGLATVLWVSAGVGIGAANAARKWDNYSDLKTAAAAGTSTATELVGGGQVTAAKIDAIIESAFFFLDAVGAGVKGVKGVAALGIKKAGKEAAEAAAGVAALKGLKAMSAEEAGPLVVKGIDQLGVKGAADAAGMSVDDLLKRVAAGSPAAAKIKAFMELAAGGVEASQLPEALKTVLKGGEVVGQKGSKLSTEDVVKQAIDQLGFQRTLSEAGGWKTLSAALGPSSEVGKRLKAWRDVLNSDLKKYIESLRTAADGDGPLVKETGTLENVTNDLDISFLGPRASENKASAAQFLAGRTGLGADPLMLDKMIYIGLFTDPRRMHLFDAFPQLQEKLAKRTMKFEEQLIWNDEYAKYLTKGAKGDAAAKAMAEKIAAEMEALGVTKVPGFKPLSDRAVAVLSKEQDRIHTAVEAAQKAGDMGKVESLIEEMSNIQAQINVKEGGGYFSAGGVRKFVTDKEGFPGARAATTAAHDLGATLDQVNKLRKSIVAFEAAALVAPASRDAAELAKHIKDLAKYGDRFAEAADVLRKMGAKAPNGAPLAQIADEFSQLLLQARGASVHTLQELLAKNMDGVIAKTRGAISGYDQAHVAILKALRERAGIEGIGDLAPEILRATKVRYALLQFQAVLIMGMGTAARAAGIPIQQEVRDDAGEEAGPSGAAAPPLGDFPTTKKDKTPA